LKKSSSFPAPFETLFDVPVVIALILLLLLIFKFYWLLSIGWDLIISFYWDCISRLLLLFMF